MKRRVLQGLVVCAWTFLAPMVPAADSRTILILGDSIGAGYGVPEEVSFAGRLQRKLDAEKRSFEIVNASVSGDTTASGLRRVNWVLKRKVDVMLVELGGNDGLRGITPATTRKNLEGIIDRARRRYPDIKILLAGMQMPANMGKDYTEAFRGIFPAIAKAKKVALIPFLLEGVGARPEMNLPDLIHPNAKGHERVAENVWKALEPLLSE